MLKQTIIRKILAPIKRKSALPPQKNPKYTPPPQNEEFYGHGFFLQKERIFPGVYKIGAAISGPRIADRKFYGHEDFSDIIWNVIQFQKMRKIIFREFYFNQ